MPIQIPRLTRGEMWLDASPDKDLSEKIAGALEHHKTKTGQEANVVLVNSQAVSEVTRMNGVVVVPVSYILLHHFLVGIGSND